MNQRLRALKEAISNCINIRNIVSYQVRKQLRTQHFEENAFNGTMMGISTDDQRPKELIVSLTTYSRRIYQVHLVIESLFEQNVKANHIILWLDKEEFPSIDELPINLTRLQDRGLEIAFCDNIRSYKKLIPTLKKHPDGLIITADDDILYPEDFIERLYKAYQKDSNKIHFYRGHKMKVVNGKLLPYREWDFEVDLMGASLSNFPTGVGGILYNSDLLDSEILNQDVFMKLAPTADDVWFKAMSLKKGIECEQIPLECPFRDKFFFLDAMDDMALARTNLIQNKNDEQIAAVFGKYNLIEKLR